MKKKMYLYTDGYPWGRGEKPFIEPEIDALRQHCDITIVSRASDDMIADRNHESVVPADVKVVRWKRPSSLMLALHALRYPFSKAARQEFRHLLDDGLTLGRLADSVKCFALAFSLRSFYVKQGIFDDDGAVHYSMWFSEQMLALALERRTRPIALISRIHGYDLYGYRNTHGRQPFQLFKKKMADLIIFASSNALRSFEEEYGDEVRPGQYEVNRLGVARQNRPRIVSELLGKKTLLSCSNVIPLKRVHLIVEAIAQSSHRSKIRWVHFGDGESLPEVRALAERLVVDATFFGHVDNGDIVEFYRKNAVDATILLSETEGGCPVCLQEALSFGVPIIGSNAGGIPEEVDGNGALLDVDASTAEIAQAIDEVCFASEPRARHMRNRSKMLWEARFDLKKNKEALIGLLAKRGFL